MNVLVVIANLVAGGAAVVVGFVMVVWAILAVQAMLARNNLVPA